VQQQVQPPQLSGEMFDRFGGHGPSSFREQRQGTPVKPAQSISVARHARHVQDEMQGRATQPHHPAPRLFFQAACKLEESCCKKVRQVRAGEPGRRHAIPRMSFGRRRGAPIEQTRNPNDRQGEVREIPGSLFEPPQDIGKSADPPGPPSLCGIVRETHDRRRECRSQGSGNEHRIAQEGGAFLPRIQRGDGAKFPNVVRACWGDMCRQQPRDRARASILGPQHRTSGARIAGRTHILSLRPPRLRCTNLSNVSRNHRQAFVGGDGAANSARTEWRPRRAGTPASSPHQGIRKCRVAGRGCPQHFDEQGKAPPVRPGRDLARITASCRVASSQRELIQQGEHQKDAAERCVARLGRRGFIAACPGLPQRAFVPLPETHEGDSE